MSSSELEMFYFKNPNGIINVNTAGSNFNIDFKGNVISNVNTPFNLLILLNYTDNSCCTMWAINAFKNK